MDLADHLLFADAVPCCFLIKIFFPIQYLFMNYKNLIKHAFVRQIDENDCGIACLATILNLCGLKSQVPFLRNQVYIPYDGLSLMQLRDLVHQQGLKADCVELEIEFLRNSRNPCILLMNNAQGDGHFQVCCRAERTITSYRYLMADPAGGIHYLQEEQLLDQWPTKAALYFDELKLAKPPFAYNFSASILALRIYPKMFLIAIPFLNCCILLLGATTSWMLQKLIDRSITATQESLLEIIVFLLLIINLFKNLAGYTRQMLISHFSSDIQGKLISLFADDLAAATKDRKLSMTQNSIKFLMNEIEKINRAITVFIATLMSDGVLAVLLISGIAYCDAVSGLTNIACLAIACGITIFKLPQWEKDRLSMGKTYSEAERQLSALIGERLITADPTAPADLNNYKAKYFQYLRTAKTYACKTGKTMLVIECLGTVNVILVFAIQAIRCLHEQTTFGSALLTVLFSYMITTLLPKLCDAMVTVSQGTEALRQLKFNISARF